VAYFASGVKGQRVIQSFNRSDAILGGRFVSSLAKSKQEVRNHTDTKPSRAYYFPLLGSLGGIGTIDLIGSQNIRSKLLPNLSSATARCICLDIL